MRDTIRLDSGTIVTEDQRDRISIGNNTIDIIPFWNRNPR